MSNTREQAIRIRRANPYATLKEIGHECGVTVERIRQILKSEGLPTRRISETKRRQIETGYHIHRKRTYTKEQRHANSVINNLIKAGAIKRPDVCTVCHNQKPIQAHHPDPSKPLAVVWSCQGCHQKLEQGIIPLESWMITTYDHIRQRYYWYDKDGDRHWKRI